MTSSLTVLVKDYWHRFRSIELRTIVHSRIRQWSGSELEFVWIDCRASGHSLHTTQQRGRHNNKSERAGAGFNSFDCFRFSFSTSLWIFREFEWNFPYLQGRYCKSSTSMTTVDCDNSIEKLPKFWQKKQISRLTTNFVSIIVFPQKPKIYFFQSLCA